MTNRIQQPTEGVEGGGDAGETTNQPSYTTSTNDEKLTPQQQQQQEQEVKVLRDAVVFFAVLTNFWYFPDLITSLVGVAHLNAQHLSARGSSALVIVVIHILLLVIHAVVSPAACYFGSYREKLSVLKAYSVWVTVFGGIMLILTVVVLAASDLDSPGKLDGVVGLLQAIGILNFFIWIINSHHNALVASKSQLSDQSTLPFPIVQYRSAVIFLTICSVLPHTLLAYVSSGFWLAAALLVFYLLHVICSIAGLIGAWSNTKTKSKAHLIWLCVFFVFNIVICTVSAVLSGLFYLAFLSWFRHFAVYASLFWVMTSFKQKQASQGEAGASMELV